MSIKKEEIEKIIESKYAQAIDFHWTDDGSCHFVYNYPRDLNNLVMMYDTIKRLKVEVSRLRAERNELLDNNNYLVCEIKHLMEDEMDG